MKNTFVSMLPRILTSANALMRPSRPPGKKKLLVVNVIKRLLNCSVLPQRLAWCHLLVPTAVVEVLHLRQEEEEEVVEAAVVDVCVLVLQHRQCLPLHRQPLEASVYR